MDNKIKSTDDIINSRKTAFSNKFKTDNGVLSEEEISTLIFKKLNINDITSNDYNEILTKLEINTDTNSIKIEEFLNKIKSNKNSNKHIELIHNKINNHLCTKADIILIKLKKLRNKFIINNDEESQKEFDWIIKSLDEGDIYEPMEVNIKKDENQEISEFNFLKEYSNFDKIHEREQDIKKVELYTKKHRKNVIVLKPICEYSRNSIDDLKEQIETSLINPCENTLISLLKDLENIGIFDFDIFKIFDIVGDKTLYYISYQILSHFGFYDYLVDGEKYKNFAYEINKCYSKGNPYHNSIHGVDVMQTLFVFFCNGNLDKKIKLNDIDIFSSLIAAMCHDYKHSGFTNNFEINFKTHIALTYNDHSVLENYHISETFKTLLKPENNITSNFNDEEYRLFRRRLIDCILATDMALHVKHLSSFSSKMEFFNISNGKNSEKMIKNDNALKDYENQQLILGFSLHCCDISNPAKISKVYDRWVDLIFKEFFNQGDLEKKSQMSISLLCDRETTNIVKSQIVFINFIVKPTFECIVNFIPEIDSYLKTINENLLLYEEKNKDQ